MAAARLRDIDASSRPGIPSPPGRRRWPRATPTPFSPAAAVPSSLSPADRFPAATAHKLINQINYQADVVWNNPQGYISDGSKVARLILGIFALTGILGGAAILLGLFLGGGRACFVCSAANPLPPSRKKQSSSVSTWKTRTARSTRLFTQGVTPLRHTIRLKSFEPVAVQPNS